MIYAIAILCVVCLCYFAAKEAMHRFGKKTEAIKPCTECGKELFACKTCGCIYDEEFEARKCADYDRILSHSNHRSHHHEERDDDY